MKKHLTKLAVIIAIAAAACGCRRELDFLSTKEVNFKAVSEVSYITKTSYSGDVNASSLERIDWENGDLIRIVSDVAATEANSHTQDYSLSVPSASGKFSYSTASPSGSDHGLLWGGGTNKFFAVYPAGPLAYSAGSSVATFTLPADQTGSLHNGGIYYGNMDLAFMTAATTGTSGDEITLSFTPAMTTFYVTVTNTTGNTMSLQKVALTCDNEPLTGSYTAEISAIEDLDGEHNARNYRLDYLFDNGGVYGGTLPAESEANNTIYASFSPALSVPVSGSVVVALFAMPRNAFNNRSGYCVDGVDGVEGKGGFISHLTLSVTSSEGVVSLPLKDKDSDDWIKFASEHKHNISNVNVPAVASYVLDVEPALVEYDHTGVYSDEEFVVTSKKTINSVDKQAPWKTQVQVGGAWVDLSTVLSDPSTYPDYTWLSDFPVTSESAAEAATTTTRTFRKSVTAREVVSHEERLRNGVVYDTDGSTPVTHNTAGTAVDLSKYDFVNRKMENARYTANTYIISAPGYYKIPIVYGNAIENNSTIPDSYNGRTGLGHLNYFICPLPNGDESSIHLVSTRPWLNSARSQGARIHWEKYSYWDDTDEEMKTFYRKWSDAAGVSVIDNLSIEIGSGNERFIVFHVDETNIRPGNWVIASMTNSDGTGNVCWSWQIWITDQSMTPVTINNGTSNYSILPVNLGWVDLNKGQFYPQREATLRFASTEKEGLYSEHTLTVRQKQEEIVSEIGWSTFYQWGRKDPMTEGPIEEYDNDGMVHESIKHPGNIMYDKGSFFGERYYDWTVNNYNNLWDSKNTDYESPSGDLPNHKTVYDPSPRRYCVPPDYTFDGFSTYDSASSAGLYFATVGGGTVFFPAAGYMNYIGPATSKGDDVMSGYWTYHPWKSVQRRQSYCMRFTYNSSTSDATVGLQQYSDMDRALAMSVRPVFYGVAIVPGLMETELVFADAGWTNGQDIKDLAYTSDGVTVTFGKRSSVGSDPSFNASGEVVLDIYSTITVEVASGKQISEIVLEFGPNDHGDGAGSPNISVSSPSGSSYSNGVWAATNNNGTLVPVTNSVVLQTAGTGLTYDRYISAIKITYKD